MIERVMFCVTLILAACNGASDTTDNTDSDVVDSEVTSDTDSFEDSDETVDTDMVDTSDTAHEETDVIDTDTCLSYVTWYVDADDDKIGDTDLSTQVCVTVPIQRYWSLTPGDCDDSDPTVGAICETGSGPPDADLASDTGETGISGETDSFGGTDTDDTQPPVDTDAVDTDLSGGPDPLDVDDDGDGQSENQGDCDDGDADVHPGAHEACDHIDNNCDGSTDGADAVGKVAWLQDSDHDGLGDESVEVLACDQPAGYVSVASGYDCDPLAVSTLSWDEVALCTGMACVDWGTYPTQTIAVDSPPVWATAAQYSCARLAIDIAAGIPEIQLGASFHTEPWAYGWNFDVGTSTDISGICIPARSAGYRMIEVWSWSSDCDIPLDESRQPVPPTP